MWKTGYNRITAWLITFCMLAGMTMTVAPITAHAVDEAPWEGAGSEGDPYLIASVQDLIWVSDAVYSEYLGAYFEQTADIDLSGVPEWTPVGTFSGYYDGKGFAVRNLVINNPGSNYVGLFSIIRGGAVDDLHLTGADITGYESVGILAGKIENSGKAVNCSAAGDVKGWQYVGGLVGNVEGSGSMITHSSSEGTVTGSGDYTGGLAGNNRGQIERCFSACTVNSSGLYIGGLAGANWNGSIRNSYATGNVTGSSNVGGLVGWHGTGNTVEKSYSTGFVSGVSSGGLIGVSSSATVSGSYYSSSSGKSDSGKGTSKSPADLKKQSTFTGWDFTNAWKIGEEASAPTLRWQSWSADERVTADWSALIWDAVRGTNSAADNITASVVLPAAGTQGSSILWDAVPQGYINTETGAVTRPENENISVTLTATVSYEGGTSRTKAFVLTVKKTVTGYYAVTYNANGGTGTPPAESDKEEGEPFTAAAADAFTPPEDKQFEEWNTSADGSGDSYRAEVTVPMPAHALNLYAIWRDVLSAAAGSALGFDGADDYINTGAFDLANRSFSIDFWLKRGAAGQQYVVSQGESGATGQILHIGFREDNKFTFAFWGDDIDTDAGYSDTAWHHWAVTYDETTKAKKIYRDGILVKTGTANGSYTGNGALFIGKRFDGYNFKGELDELRIWGEARTEKQIRETMHNTLSGIPDELLAYYQFNENTGTHTADAISTANRTLSNFNMNANSGWVVSTVPTGGGTAASAASFQEGIQALGNIAIDVTEPFDNASDVYANEIANPPNSSTGIGGTLYPDKYWIMNAFGSPGTFTASLTFTLPAGFITQEDIDNPENLALYGRESHSAGPWSLRARAASATATAVTFEGITSFGPFAISSYSEPTVQASGVGFSGIAPAAMNISWTNGNGESRMVLMKAGSAVDGSPADKTGYTAHGIYGSGDSIGSGNYVVYAGSGNSVTVTGLNPNTAYYVAVYEYTGSGSSANYLTASPAVGNATTPSPGTYTAIYYANGGTGDAVTVPDITEGTPYTLAQNTFTPPAGKQFKEWNTLANGSGDGYGAEATVTMPGTPLALYAIWEIEWVGDGSQSDPYRVATAEHLNAIAAKSLTAYYIQTADISLTGIWEPIGTYDIPFTGSYDGGGYTVSSLIINKPANNNVGFFGFVSGGGTIKDVHIAGADVTGDVNVGILVGIIADGGSAQGGGSIIDCSTAGTVAGTSRVGGLIGSVQNSGASVKRSHSAASVSVFGGSLNGSAGGFAGFIYQGLIEDCYSSGSVTAGSDTGGFAGHMEGGQVRRCYSAVGAIGGLYPRGFISYAPGGVVEASYYNSDTGLGDAYPDTAKTAAQLKQQDTFTAWDFNNVWKIGENVSYPTLQWQPWTPDERITADRTALDWDDIDGDNSAIDNVTTDLVLPTSGAQGSTITWSAETDTYIDIASGTVTRPPDADKTITLTATVSYTGGANQMKTFTLTVIREFSYSVTYHANNGTGTAPTETDRAAGAAFTAANNTFTPPSGKQFKHWYTNPIGTGGTAYAQGAAVTMPAGGLILYALWEDDSPEVKRSYLEVITLAGGTVRLNGNETPISPVFSLQYTVGEVVRLEAVASPGHTFEYWLNVKNSSVISTDPVYEAAVGAGINIMAVFSKTPAAEDTHFTVTFKDRSGKLLQSTSIARNGTVTPPIPLVWEGYGFSEWSRVFDSVTSDLVITAIYVRADTTYTVTVENGSLSAGGNEGNFKFDIPVTVAAGAAPDGQQFSHWEQDGKKVSTKPAFTFYTPMRDTTLAAVFADGDTVLENTPFITLSDDVMSNMENGTITFTAIKDVPAGYTLVECGVLLLEADAPLGGELTVDTGNVILGKILDSSTDQFYIMKAHVEEGDTWHGRAYLIYKDGDGNPFTVYSDNTVYKTLQR